VGRVAWGKKNVQSSKKERKLTLKKKYKALYQKTCIKKNPRVRKEGRRKAKKEKMR